MAPSLPLFSFLLLLVALAGGPSDRQINRAASSTAETEVFERSRRSVFLVETESGHGSGFLVDRSGLVITNHHVVGSGRYLAVGIDPRHKYAAVVIARDPVRDLALLRVHPAAVEQVTPLPLARAAASRVRVGERVLAIGSALTGDGTVLTAGMVSRVTDDTFIADLNVNSGTSGGPLLNLAGEVVGICTFYMKAPAGPGLAGIMRADSVQAFVDGVNADALEKMPSPDRLPVASPTPYPAAALRERALALRDPSAYGVKISGMRIDVLTPPVVYLLGHDQEIRKARDQRYTWLTHSAEMEAIVAIRAVPALISVPGEPVRFTRDLERLRLLRNGVDVVPIVPGRFCSSSAAQTTLRQPVGCFGLYQYDPSAFAPDGELELQVFLDGSPKPHVWKLPTTLVKRVWSDFAPWLSLAERDVPR